MIVKHSGACRANDGFELSEPIGISWIDPARNRVSRIRRILLQAIYKAIEKPVTFVTPTISLFGHIYVP